MTRRGASWAEFLALFVGAPLAIALFLPPRQMFTALFAFAVAGLGLLWWTGNFRLAPPLARLGQGALGAQPCFRRAGRRGRAGDHADDASRFHAGPFA